MAIFKPGRQKKSDIKHISEALKKVHEESMQDFDRAVMGQYEEREQSLGDRRFYSIAGAQWEGDLGDLFENKPQVEINKGHSAIIRIFNEYRNNRITVDYISRDGIDREELADSCDRLYRASEMLSNADEAYDNAFEEAVGGGFGAWRLRADYEDELNPDDQCQIIYIEPIFDADSCVFFNYEAKRQDKSKATQCWVLCPYTWEYYQGEWDDDPATWPKEINQDQFDWSKPNLVYVAEHYKVEYATEDILVYTDPTGEEVTFVEEDFDDDPGLMEKILFQGYSFKEQKTVKRKKVHKYLESGTKVLEDCGYIAGTEIPIIPMFGKHWVVDGIERFMGQVRLYKDPQRVKNAMYSQLLQLAGMSGVEKPIFTTSQMKGHWDEWANDNIEDYPVLTVEALRDQNGTELPPNPAYTKAPQIPPATAALHQLVEKDMQDILGNANQGDKMISNIADDTVERIHDRLDMMSYIFMSNFAKAMRRSGQVWLSMAKDIFLKKGRKMMALGRDNEIGYIELMQPYEDKKTGQIMYKNDFRKANFEIFVDVGPSSKSAKDKNVKHFTELLKYTDNPEDKIILQAMIIMNKEGEGLQEIKQYYRKKLIKLGVLEPSDEERDELVEEAQSKPPDVNEEYLKSAAMNEQAKAQRAVADTEKAKAQTEETRAKTIETLSKVDRENRQAAIDTASKINEAFQSGNQPTAQPVETTNNMG